MAVLISKGDNMVYASLSGIRVAVIVGNGFEQLELSSPLAALEVADAVSDVLAPGGGLVRGWNRIHWGSAWLSVGALGEAMVGDYDALLLPGGILSSDALRGHPEAVAFVRVFMDTDRPGAAIGYGLQLLIDADVVRRRILTSAPSIRSGLSSAGAIWISERVVVDQGLVASRSSTDMPAFMLAMLEEFAEVGRRRMSAS